MQRLLVTSLAALVLLVYSGLVPGLANPDSKVSSKPTARAAANISPASQALTANSCDIQVWQSQILWPVHWLVATLGQGVAAGSEFGSLVACYASDSGTTLWNRRVARGVWTKPLTTSTSIITCSSGLSITSRHGDTGRYQWAWRAPVEPGSEAGTTPAAPICKARLQAYGDNLIALTVTGQLVQLDDKGALKKTYPLVSATAKRSRFWGGPVVWQNFLLAPTLNGELWNVDLANNRGRCQNIEPLPTKGTASPTHSREVRTDSLLINEQLFFTTMDGTLYAYNLSNTEQPSLAYQYKLPGHSRYQTNAYGYPICQPLASADSQLLFCCTKTAISAVTASQGKLLWKQYFKCGLASSPVQWQDYLIAASEDAGLLVFEPTRGRLVARVQLPAVPSCAPCAAGNYVVVGYADGTINCLDLRKMGPL